MSRYDHIIIGGGVAGITAAETVRACAAGASMLVVGAEPHRLYSRVMLPHVIRGRVTEDKVFLRQPGSLEDKGIHFLPGVSAVGVEPASRRIRLSDGSEAEYGQSLLLATGGAVRHLECPGADDAEVMYFQTLEDCRRIAGSAARRAVVIGGGFIAMELAMSFVHIGAEVTVVIRGDGFFSRMLGDGARSAVADELRRHGVKLLTGRTVAGIETAAGIRTVHLDDGTSLECDAIAAGLGIRVETDFLSGSGIATADGIVADSRLRTSAPDVYAAGDAAQVPDPFSSESRIIGNWQNAMFQGKLAGANMCGGQERYGALTAYSIACFGLPLAFVGHADAKFDGVIRETMNGSLRLFLKEDRVVGAACAGAFSERAAVTRLITERIVFSRSMKRAAAESATPLAAFLP